MQVNRQHTTTAAAVSNTAVIWNKLSGSIHYKHTYTDNTNYNTGATLMLAAQYKLTNNRPIIALCAAVIFFNTRLAARIALRDECPQVATHPVACRILVDTPYSYVMARLNSPLIPASWWVLRAPCTDLVSALAIMSAVDRCSSVLRLVVPSSWAPCTTYCPDIIWQDRLRSLDG